MACVKGPAVFAKVAAGSCSVPLMSMIGPINGGGCSRIEFWGFTGSTKLKTTSLSCHINMRKCKTVNCSFNSSSNGSGSMADNFNENDEDYVNSSILEAGIYIYIGFV